MPKNNKDFWDYFLDGFGTFFAFTGLGGVFLLLAGPLIVQNPKVFTSVMGVFLLWVLGMTAAGFAWAYWKQKTLKNHDKKLKENLNGWV